MFQSVMEESPGCGEPGGVVAPIDERDEDGQNQQADLRILHQGEGEQRLQEGGGQRRQQVAALIALRHLRRAKTLLVKCGSVGLD